MGKRHFLQVINVSVSHFLQVISGVVATPGGRGAQWLIGVNDYKSFILDDSKQYCLQIIPLGKCSQHGVVWSSAKGA
jgi:hypothetical protein